MALMPSDISDENILPGMIPFWEDEWRKIVDFALTAYGTCHRVSFEQECEIAKKWNYESMAEARIALRFYVRASKYWSAAEPTDEQKKRIVNALESIRRITFEQTQEKSSRPLKNDNK